MAEFHIASLSIAVTALTLLSFAAAKKPELATEVCKNTTDFNFCRSAVYSDPRAATADRYELIDIVYRKAYLNATDTRDYIASKVKSGGTESESLKKCLRDYNKAIQKLKEMLGNLNDESYYQLDVYSLDVEKSVRNCRNVLQKGSIIWGKDENMMKLANICYVVSKLFEYHD